jgi:hypothetical protein
MKQDCDTEAKRLEMEVDIAIESFTQYPPKDFTKENLDQMIRIYAEWKYSILHPAPKFKKIASLKYHIQDVFTHFQEGTGATVEHFWAQLTQKNLGYTRENKLRKIITRGKIKEH